MAASRGQLETSALKQNLEDQLDRLVQQLADLEQCKDELEPDEYEDSKKDTLEQLNELGESLTRMKKGNLSLVDDVDRIQLAIQAAISEAFKTPEVIRMFTKKQPGQLREHLAQVERNEKIGHISLAEAKQKKIEILTALQKLNEKLKPEEELLIKSHQQESLKQFKRVEDEAIGRSKVLNVIGNQVKASGHG